MAIGLQRSTFFEALRKHESSSTAIVNHGCDATYEYDQLLRDVAGTKDQLIQMKLGSGSSIAGQRIAFLVENGYDYVGTHIPVRLYIPWRTCYPTDQLPERLQSPCSPFWPLMLLHCHCVQHFQLPSCATSLTTAVQFSC